MTEQMDHRAAIEFAAWLSGPGKAMAGTDGGANLARCHLDSVRKAWPGVVPVAVWRGENGLWNSVNLRDSRWCNDAEKFERDYPGLKVDEPFLVTVMEGVK